jgi:hypothetical protein
VSDGPDPLGKRALFWAPAERDDGPPKPAERDATGKHALFSQEARASPVLSGPGRRLAALAANDKPRRAAASDRSHDRGGAESEQSGGRVLPGIAVSCSSCGASSRVDVLEFLLLHLPLWVWKPGRGYTRFMTCPSCRRRTWVSASWAPRLGARQTARDAG